LEKGTGLTESQAEKSYRRERIRKKAGATQAEKNAQKEKCTARQKVHGKMY